MRGFLTWIRYDVVYYRDFKHHIRHHQEWRVVIFVTHTPDLLRQDCPMSIVVVHLDIPFAQIYHMTETESEHTYPEKISCR